MRFGFHTINLGALAAPEQTAEDLRAYQRLGVSHLVFSFRTRHLVEARETIERFATQIWPLVP